MKNGLRVFDADTHVEPTAEVIADTTIIPSTDEGRALRITGRLNGTMASFQSETAPSACWNSMPIPP